MGAPHRLSLRIAMAAVEAAGNVDAKAGERQLPAVFGRYLLLKRLSRGGMGEIFLAKLGEIQGFEKLVIIKKILPNLGADQEFIKRFIDEAQVAIKLSHANIAPVFEVGKVDGEYFLAIEYVEGRDLRRLVGRLREEKTRLPPDLCVYIVREVVSGLAYAHRRTDDKGQHLALVHCDISPPNVMISFEGEVKVIDFGIAKSAIRIAGTNPNMGFGKFGYMAPEQLIRGGVVDKRTDIYAAGVVLYELLTGERLFTFPEGGDYRQIARMVTQGKITPPSARDPRLDPDFDPIVMRALATRQEDRYQTAEEFRDALSAKLSQLNPTFSADDLSHFMRRVFSEEISEEHRLVADMKAIDIAPFKEELTQATSQHTVTFARAGSIGGLGRLTGSKRAITSSQLKIPTEEQLLMHPRRRLQFIVGGTVAMLAGGALVLLLARPAPPPPVATQVSLPPPVVTPIKTVPVPVATELPPTPPAPPKKVDHDKRRRPKGVAARPVETAPKGHSPEAVESKFQKVKTEYSSFKAQYGSVLEDRWNAIASEITFGKGDKFAKVDQMLDQLRKEMAKVKAGG
jgi:eukaryotic-like serine/threonine-protein kinase